MPAHGRGCAGHERAAAHAYEEADDELFVMDEFDDDHVGEGVDSNFDNDGPGGSERGGGGGGGGGGGRGGEDVGGVGVTARQPPPLETIPPSLVGLLRHARLRVLDLSDCTDVAVAHLLHPHAPPPPLPTLGAVQHRVTGDWRAEENVSGGGERGGAGEEGGEEVCGQEVHHRGLPAGLRVLKLNGCVSLGVEGLDEVMPPMLTQLEMNYCPVSDASIEAVAAKCRGLRELGIMGVHLGDAGAAAIGGFLQHLQVLQLTDSRNLTDLGRADLCSLPVSCRVSSSARSFDGRGSGLFGARSTP